MFQHDESKDAFRSVPLTNCRMSKSGLGNGELSTNGGAMTMDRKRYYLNEDCTEGKNLVGYKPLPRLAQHIVRPWQGCMHIYLRKMYIGCRERGSMTSHTSH